jgi:tRNA dimethylallyltransferase
MQVYQGLDIGTAKPTLAERRQVPHHLIDVVRLTDPFDAAQFVQLAQQARQQIEQRGRVPIFCGGTGMYLKAYLEGLGSAPASDPELRHELEQMPAEVLAEELREKDPEAYGRLDLNNVRRLIRAVEVIRMTGQPFSSLRAGWRHPQSPGDYEPRFGFGLTRPRAELYRRIDQRVDMMIEQGLVEETRQLMPKGLMENRTATQAIGYRQVIQYLQGKTDWETTLGSIKQQTRHFAKRQLTWFRHQIPLQWINISEAEGLQVVSRRIREQYQVGREI